MEQDKAVSAAVSDGTGLTGPPEGARTNHPQGVHEGRSGGRGLIDSLQDGPELGVAGISPEALLEEQFPVEVSMDVQGVIEEKWPVQHVIGYRPGDFGYELCQDCLDKELVVVMAQYDSPPPGPNGEVSPAANDNASGVAVMLEAIRVLEEADYQPRRSFLFIAYGGEGSDGG